MSTTTLEPAVKTDLNSVWTKALRSGQFRQTKHVFHNQNGVCANQVLLIALGLATERITDIIPVNIAYEIICLNDDDELDFEQIATFIETKLSNDCRRHKA